MSVICYMSVICLVLGGVVRVRLYIIYAHLCNHILLQSGLCNLSEVRKKPDINEIALGGLLLQSVRYFLILSSSVSFRDLSISLGLG
jgi:hypothetical protein